MPTYDYRCRGCHKHFEAFHSMHSTEPQHCPDCGVEGQRMLSASSIIFKGSGFYTTEYRDTGYVEAQRRDSSGATSSNSTGTGSGTTSTSGTTTGSTAAISAAPSSSTTSSTPSPSPSSPAPASS